MKYLALLLLIACGKDAELDQPDAAPVVDAESPDAELPMPPVACGTQLPGPTLTSMTTEGAPGYPEALAALDTSTVVFPIDLSTESELVRTVVNWALQTPGKMAITQADVTAAGRLGQAVLGAVASSGDNSVDFKFLRRGLYYFVPCDRPLPKDLDAVRARYGDWTTWEKNELACSAPKNSPRVIYTSPLDTVYIAQTIVNGTVRETEILMRDQRADGQLDFAAYTQDGQLTDRSTFATTTSSIVSAAPYTCMTCHYDATMEKVNDLIPTGTGAGCR